MIKSHLKRILVGGLLGIGCATAYWRFSPRVYEGSSQVFINAGSNAKASDDLSPLLALGLSQSTVTEGSILRSFGTFRQALLNVSEKLNDNTLLNQEVQEDLYLMYDVEMARESRVMMVHVRAYNPDVAAAVANEVVTVYNNMRRLTSVQSFSNAQSSVQQQFDAAARDLNRAEQRVKDFKEKYHMVDFSSAMAQISGYQNTLATQLDDAMTQDASLSQSIAATQAKIAVLPKRIEMDLTEVKSPILQSIEMQIAEYEKQRTELLRLYTPTSTKVRELDDVISQTKVRLLAAQKNIWQKTTHSYAIEPVRAQLEQQLAQSQISLVSLRARQRALKKELAKQSALSSTLPEKERLLGMLLRDQSVFNSKYMRLKVQLEELKLQSDANFLPAVNIYAAQANPKPISPQASKILPLGLLAGGILGLLFGFIRESMRSTARTSEEVSALFELPVVATVPMLPESSVRRNLLSLSKRTHVPQESFRFMASAAALAQSGHRRVVFTSSGGNVGCSSAAGEFAVAAAKMGIDTILIDADTTFGTITRAFKMTDKPGLRDILGRKLLAMDDVPLAHSTDHPNLSVLPIGGEDDSPEISDTPKALLMGLLESLQDRADLIVIDCPPIDVVADTSRFVPMVDEVCLVVSARKTSLQSISLARALLERCGAQTVSVVLTGAAPKEEAFNSANRYSAARR